MEVVKFYFRLTLIWLLLVILSGCVAIPYNQRYKGPTARPVELDIYYSKGTSYSEFKDIVVGKDNEVTQREIRIGSPYGEIIVDYFDHSSNKEDLVLVFPLLGGRPIVSNHFARYFSRHGIDAAIIRRNDDFKNPALFDKIEKLLQENVIRDRIALDFFEEIYGKKNFGGFGVSRGAINLATTAGVDPRIKYPVIAMGASDIPLIFKHSDQRRIQRYVDQVMAQKNISRTELFSFLGETIKTDPKMVAQHIDARNTLMILCVFDQTVPYEYGRRLREEIGKPRTIFLIANHYTGVLYTQLFSVLPADNQDGLFPFDYIELESLEFFRRSFDHKKSVAKLWPFKILRAPLDLIGILAEKIF